MTAAYSSLVDSVSAGFLEFWAERHLCTLTTVRRDGTPHVVPVNATLDSGTATARVLSSSTSHKARQIAARGSEGARVALCQAEGRRWSTLEGVAVVRDDADSVADAERRYAERYRTPRANPRRIVIEIAITRVLGNV